VPTAAITIDRHSDTPVTEQVAAQLIYLIGSGQLRAGEPLPSARGLAMRLKVHRNTISDAFQDPTLASLVEKARGKRLRVRSSEARVRGAHLDLLIDEAVGAARQAGYTPRQLYDRMHDRLRATPPERVLVVSEDQGMRVLIAMELRQGIASRVEDCSLESLGAQAGRLAGALVVTTPSSLSLVERLLPAGQPCVSVSYSPIDEHVNRVRALPHASVVGVVSISSYFLELARALLAPTLGRRHSLREYLMRKDRATRIGAVDLLFCDAITYGILRLKCPGVAVVRHDVIADVTLKRIAATLKEVP
jgi:DNA-binding transcriptional regulator YhcF (GntR family)